jgi:hypothetical protein
MPKILNCGCVVEEEEWDGADGSREEAAAAAVFPGK